MALGIKAVQAEVESPKQTVKAYEIPITREMELLDGTKAMVVVQKLRITKAQLEAQIVDAQAKLDEINALEAKDLPQG
jgi:hypothetical protein